MSSLLSTSLTFHSDKLSTRYEKLPESREVSNGSRRDFSDIMKDTVKKERSFCIMQSRQKFKTRCTASRELCHNACSSLPLFVTTTYEYSEGSF